MFPSISLTASNFFGMEYVLGGGDARSVWTSIFGTDAMSVEIEINSCDKIDPRESSEAQVIDHFREQLATMEPLPTKESPAQEALPKEEE